MPLGLSHPLALDDRWTELQLLAPALGDGDRLGHAADIARHDDLVAGVRVRAEPGDPSPRNNRGLVVDSPWLSVTTNVTHGQRGNCVHGQVIVL